MKIKEYIQAIEIPSDIKVSYANHTLKMNGKGGEVTRVVVNPRSTVKVDAKEVTITCLNATKRDKMQVNTQVSHIKNMIRGAQKAYVYELKICSGHFPMTAAIKGSEFELKNFLGEAFSRKTQIKAGAKVVIAGDKITVESANIELAGQIAADLEQVTRISNRDRRVFQDGIYITKKDGNPI